MSCNCIDFAIDYSVHGNGIDICMWRILLLVLDTTGTSHVVLEKRVSTGLVSEIELGEILTVHVICGVAIGVALRIAL